MSTHSLTLLPSRNPLPLTIGSQPQRLSCNQYKQPISESRSEKAIQLLPGSLGMLTLEEAGHHVRSSTTLRCHAVGKPPGEAKCRPSVSSPHLQVSPRPGTRHVSE